MPRFKPWQQDPVDSTNTTVGDGNYVHEVVSGKVVGLKPESTAGSAWNNIVSLALSTLTGWTAGAGSWSITSSVIRQATTAAAVYRLRYTAARIPLSEVIVEVDVKMISPSGANSRVGVVFGAGWSSDVTGGLLVAPQVNAGVTAVTVMNWEYDAILAGPSVTLPSSLAFNTWATLRVHKVGNNATAWLDGVLVGTGTIQQSANREQGTIALYCYGAEGQFRNLDVWVPVLP